MKKILLLFCAMLTCVGMSAKDIYGYVLGEEMTLTEAAASEKGFVLVSDNQILGIANNGDAGLKMYDVNDVAVAYMVKLESIAGVTGESATEPNAYHVLFYKPNATKVEAGDRYGIWGNPNCALTAVGWGDTWVAPFNGEKPDGRDFDYSSRWNFEAQPGGGYAVYFNNPVEGNPDAKKYLNGGRISDNLQKVWHLHPLTKQKVGHTTFDLTKVSFQEAKNSSNPVVMIQNDLVLCNSNGGANYSTKEGFDEFAYWVKFEDYSATDNQYYITLNKEDGSRVNYLNASVWSHIFLSGVDKAGTNGEKQNGAVFIIADLGENKYSIRDLGAVQGAYDEDKVNEGYVNFTTSGYWANNATWRNTTAGEWEFYTVTNKKDVLDDPEPEPEPWVCPEGEIDVTTLPWVKNANNCDNRLGEMTDATVYGTDASPGATPLSYIDITNYSTLKVYGPKGQRARFFINRDEFPGNFQFYADINEEGVGILDLYSVLSSQAGAEYIHLNGIKANAYGQKVQVDGVTVIEKPAPYTISTTAGKIGTIALDYPASIEGATLYEVVDFNTTDGLFVAEVEGDMVGGTPYIYQATADEVVFAKKGAAVAHGDFDCTKGNVGNGLVGCYSEVSPSASSWFGFIRDKYIISNGTLRKISNGNVTIPANRCFFDPDPSKFQPKAAGVKMQLGFAENATAISNVNAALEGGKIYDLNGREVKSMKKGGIYIMGGMKVSVK